MLKIVTAPNPILSQTAESITKIDSFILRLIQEMKQTLIAAKDPEGVGLAAPQVGKSLRLFIVKPTPKSPIQVFINPKIIDVIQTNLENNMSVKSPRRSSTTKLEGCLSLPGIWGKVFRSPKITINYLDEKSKPHTRKFTGLLSIIAQHEIDHLNGILFPKRVLEQKQTLYKSKKNEKGEDIFEEIDLTSNI